MLIANALFAHFQNYYNSDFITGNDEITNCFAQYFSNVLNMPSGSQTVSDSYNTNFPPVDFNSCVLTFRDVYKELNKITSKTCLGPDKMSNIFFIQCTFVLSTLLMMLFNRSLVTGVFPDKWKTSYVSPVLKSGDINHTVKFRTVSIISIIPKIFEGIV